MKRTDKLHICLIEDDELMGEALCERFEMEGFEYEWHKLGKAALPNLRRRRYSIVVSDINLPDLSGEEVFMQLRQARQETAPFLFMTAYGATDQAVRLLKLGAADYISKPLDVDLLVARIRELGGPLEPVSSGGVFGVSAAMQRIEQTLARLANSDGTALITGESGVGKERVARHLHDLGEDAASKPFVAVNCGAIPETLLEAELFGYEKGAFTGAVKERRGCFEQANGGTLFLDEIGDMPLVMQIKLLRAIQERVITRIGSEAPMRLNVRLICATHGDLRQLVEAGSFREDLFYRINVFHLHVPPLRERREDILWLANRFAGEQSAKKDAPAFSFHPAAERAMLSYPWPGNIRELKHCIERACLMSDRPQLDASALFGESPLPTPGGSYTGDTLLAHLDACEKRYVEQALAAHAWRVGHTADSLGISRKSLWERMRKYDIAEPGKKHSS